MPSSPKGLIVHSQHQIRSIRRVLIMLATYVYQLTQPILTNQTLFFNIKKMVKMWTRTFSSVTNNS
ncbi:hypothetical protein GND95_03185 [Defluviitalea raffinosedens]|uniref:Uncharacterized protein n=1 Tax=Defluviitalea raffinosedens TaxID=1450156 RepID=A0A7C8HJ85_9FIRM|nr:hypothetical protein GND95_03185 [Defluviitalea raffinosedens]